MTLESTTVKVSYAGDGSTVSFPVTFVYWADTDIEVILRTDATGAEETWVNGTQYTLSGGDGSTGTLTVDTSPTDYTPATGETLVIRSNREDTQTTDFPLGGSFPTTSAETANDQTVRLVQQHSEELSRTIKVSKTSPLSEIELPEPEAGNVLVWNGTEDGFDNSAPFAGSVILNENDMGTNSTTQAPSQASVKAFATQTFNNVAAMVASTTLNVGETVRTLGYYAAGDGGENDYSIVAAATGTEDGGKYIDLSTHQALGLFVNGHISVTQFGAKADGSTDDYTAISNAITVADGVGIGRVFLKHTGTSMISAGLVIGENGWISLIGSGRGTGNSKIRAMAGFTGDMITLEHGSCERFSIGGSSVSTSGHRGIVIGSASVNNASCRISSIACSTGLYDFIATDYENDTTVIEDIQCFSEVGRGGIYLTPAIGGSPTAGATLRNIHMNNPVTAPAAGDVKKVGIFLGRTDSVQLTGAIVNNYDTNIALGTVSGDNKNWALNLNSLHIEDHRTAIDTVWAATTAISEGDYAVPTDANVNGRFYVCTTAGTTAGAEPTWPTTDAGTVVDGTVTWTEVGKSIAIDLGQNDSISIKNTWIDDPLVGLRGRSTHSTTLENCRITCECACYLAYDGIGHININNSTLSGDVILTAGGASTVYSASFTAVTNDSIGAVPDTTNGWYRSHAVQEHHHKAVTKTANYTATLLDDIILGDATSGNIVITIPNFTTGKVITVYKFDASANTVTVTPAFNYLEGGASHSLAAKGDSVITMTRSGSNPIKLNVV